MRNIHRIFLLGTILLAIAPKLGAQVNNWARVQAGTSVVRIHAGLDHGLVYGAYYGKAYPFLGKTWSYFVDASLPMGGSAVDDNRLKLGTSVNALQLGHWAVSADLAFINRKFSVPFVEMYGLAIETALQFGYYRNRAFLALGLSNDYNFATRLRHTEAYKGNYPEAVDGWYANTANNLSIGINTGLSLKKMDITLSTGVVRAGGFTAKPTLPLFGKLGVNYRMGK
jgi:hypothetical protein